MKGFLIVILIVGFFSLSAKAGSLVDYQLRVEVIEQQATISCGPSEARADPIRTEIASRIISPTGSTSVLVKEMQESAKKVSDALDNAEQIVVAQKEPIFRKQKEDSENKLQTALNKLQQSVARRAPASVSDDLRDQVKQAYGNYQRAHEPPRLNEQMIRDISSFRQSQLSELKGLSDLSDRVEKARKKAWGCYCRAGSIDCKTTEQLKEETDLLNAQKDRKAAEHHLFDQPETQQVTSGVGK